ncbi:hypothetical protein BVG19_g2182 [[Candida] boidinii]|nr:hypothetical protein BVG19_g2182 [[Candida] boidinii]OWB50743.1 hypothetical protein B5S27_g2295 [[Candida] boidinii]OWB65308.1 hypothetical protein B5S30_g632 [[Candida] boidinii]OWB85901.1 hypothetical protein B5S33_g4576 [[Candida] boidinii]
MVYFSKPTVIILFFNILVTNLIPQVLSFAVRQDAKEIKFKKYTYESIYSDDELNQSVFTKRHLNILKNETKNLFEFAWDKYMEFGYPFDEVKPIVCLPNKKDMKDEFNSDRNDVLGNFTATLFDSLDTFIIMNDYENFQKYSSLINETYKNFKIDSNIQVFETNIRILGSLLTCHLFAIDDRTKFNLPDYNGFYLNLAYDLGKRLILAYNTDSGIPFPKTNLMRGPFYLPNNKQSETCSAGVTTLIIEFTLLSRLTNDPIFEKLTKFSFLKIWDSRSNIDLIPMTINPLTNIFNDRITGIGASIDSFYEYALKYSILFNDELFNNIWFKSIKSLLIFSEENMIFQNLYFFNGLITTDWIDSLSAFFPGLLALNGNLSISYKSYKFFLKIWNYYGSIPERLNIRINKYVLKYFESETYKFNSNAKGMTNHETSEFLLENSVNLHWYPLRPEFIESTYYLYRSTKDPIFLNIGQSILRQLRNEFLSPCGFSGIDNIKYNLKKDRMESFVLSETLKYLYLLFDEDNFTHRFNSNLIFSTEGHPFWFDNYLLNKNSKFQIIDNNSENGEIDDYKRLSISDDDNEYQQIKFFASNTFSNKYNHFEQYSKDSSYGSLKGKIKNFFNFKDDGQKPNILNTAEGDSKTPNSLNAGQGDDSDDYINNNNNSSRSDNNINNNISLNTIYKNFYENKIDEFKVEVYSENVEKQNVFKNKFLIRYNKNLDFLFNRFNIDFPKDLKTDQLILVHKKFEVFYYNELKRQQEYLQTNNSDKDEGQLIRIHDEEQVRSLMIDDIKVAVVDSDYLNINRCEVKIDLTDPHFFSNNGVQSLEDDSLLLFSDILMKDHDFYSYDYMYSLSLNRPAHYKNETEFELSDNFYKRFINNNEQSYSKREASSVQIEGFLDISLGDLFNDMNENENGNEKTSNGDDNDDDENLFISSNSGGEDDYSSEMTRISKDIRNLDDNFKFVIRDQFCVTNELELPKDQSNYISIFRNVDTTSQEKLLIKNNDLFIEELRNLRIKLERVVDGDIDIYGNIITQDYIDSKWTNETINEWEKENLDENGDVKAMINEDKSKKKKKNLKQVEDNSIKRGLLRIIKINGKRINYGFDSRFSKEANSGTSLEIENKEKIRELSKLWLDPNSEVVRRGAKLAGLINGKGYLILNGEPVENFKLLEF